MKSRALILALSLFSFSSVFAVGPNDNTQNSMPNMQNNAPNMQNDASNMQNNAPNMQNSTLNTTQPNIQTSTQTNPQTKDENNNANKDGEVIAWLIVLNENEIAATKEVSKRHVSPIVRKYASMVRRDHTKNLRDTMNLSRKLGDKPVQTDSVVSLKEEGKKELDSLKPLNNQQFQIAFIDAMVNGHTAALTKIDQELSNNVNNPDLKKLLEATRTRIEFHLKNAKAIQEKLKANA